MSGGERARRRSPEGGFSLVELLVVIVILGVLASVAAFAVGGVNDRGRRPACVFDVRAVDTASVDYYAKHGSYAADLPALVSAGFLRSAPGTGNGYTIGYNATGGVVTATPACSTL